MTRNENVLTDFIMNGENAKSNDMAKVETAITRSRDMALERRFNASIREKLRLITTLRLTFRQFCLKKIT